ncbi:MAG: ATP-binding protein [Gemmatimonadota bacterium]|nr:ATP-binding protein [Gemmatimonadota bacterium]
MLVHSLRSKFLLVAIGGVLIPLAVVGLWLAQATERSGETLLRERLDNALVRMVEESGTRWIRTRGELLDIAEDPVVQSAFKNPATLPAGSDDFAQKVMAASYPALQFGSDARATIVLRPARGATRWVISGVGDSTARLERPTNRVITADAGLVSVAIPVHDRATGAVMGSLYAHVPVTTLVPANATAAGVIGAVLGLVDRTSGRSLVPLPFDPTLLANSEFNLGDDRWVVERRILSEPAVALVAAAPLTAYTAPFKSAARQGAIWLLIVAVTALALVTLLTSHLTRSLEQLAEAADSVSRGNLDRRVHVTGDDEVSRMAIAFNTMTESLRNTLSELTRRERLTAVGEFAGSLAHEVRNPLTSIRVNLQRVEEQITPDSSLRTPVERALREISRLERTVAGALRVARSGTVTPELIELRIPIERAAEVAESAFEEAGAKLESLPDGLPGVLVNGDVAALEQVFLNLFLNAAQAIGEGGRAGISVATDAGHVSATVWDSGAGIPKEFHDRVFEPFFTTKAEGTGLGLAVSRQIVVAHGGEITAGSGAEGRNAICVRLPLATRSIAAGNLSGD